MPRRALQPGDDQGGWLGLTDAEIKIVEEATAGGAQFVIYSFARGSLRSVADGSFNSAGRPLRTRGSRLGSFGSRAGPAET